MTRRWLAVAGAAAVVVAAGAAWYYTQQRPPAEAGGRRDPAMATLVALRVLESRPQTRLTREQIATILPLLRALRDVPAGDVRAAASLARSIRAALTPEQVEALREARRRFRERAEATDGVRPPGPRPFGFSPLGPGGQAAASEERRAQLRARLFDGMIRSLEQRMQ
ncbi:MAG: hypothetical protein QN174_02000 [Armatimonadota bacterium]|nr:hypothetical protein [Armatimonadota bacterium]MDR7421377.1 hypothetical protein [Armatimonadota bacterium]MDR7453892.1 hypothetical protein [Armatimonadota bacterium]MDR7456685.1 hypothetical protein [Armatimonadota bacterium]MDR7495720.1 hypothetical protein [Armatimonadota bacterium]